MSITPINIPGASSGQGMPPFPESQAQQSRQIVEHYEVPGREAFLWLLDKIRDMLGHHDRVMHVSSAWGVGVKERMIMPIENLTTVESDIKAYWTGPASESFLEYIKNISSCAQKIQEVSDSMGQSVSGLLDIVTNVYCQCIQFITDCFSALLEATSGILDNIGNLFGMIGGIIDACNSFMQKVSKALQDVLKDINALRAKALEAQRTVAGMTMPPVMPVSVADSDGWDVRPRKD